MNTIKPTICGILFIALAVGIFYWGLNLFYTKAYYYNAYAPGYDEYFIVKSYAVMPVDTIVHFDDNAVVTNQKTGYACKILSPYMR